MAAGGMPFLLVLLVMVLILSGGDHVRAALTVDDQPLEALHTTRRLLQANLAQNKPTLQSSIAVGGDNSRAVDGNPSPNWGDGSCSHTNQEANSWWRVDLGASLAVGIVKVFNRQDCCSDRLVDYQVRVGNVAGPFANAVCGTLTAAAVQSVNCGGRQGRYVYISKQVTGILTLCEVQVFEAANLALGKQTMQSSIAYGGDMSRAVDGNLSPNWGDSSCSHTNEEANSWWRVDLGASVLVGVVKVVNRQDCCPGRLTDYLVRVGDVAGAFNNPVCGSLTADAVQTVNCGGRQGRYVYISKQATGILTLCEVQVFAAANVALGKPTSQSSIAYSGDMSRAVDGNTSPFWGDSTCSHTNQEAMSWWRVDLGSSLSVGAVKVFNRQDCCPDRLAGFLVRVGDVAGAFNNPVCGSLTSDAVQIVDCGGRQGRYVYISKQDVGILTLCEVQVYEAANLALGKPASQSSIAHGGDMARAVDGNTSPYWGDSTCSHTNEEANSWWRVDLGSSQAVGMVRVVNRLDCCSVRLADYQVRVGDTAGAFNNAVCGTLTADAVQNIDCAGRTGRYVYISKAATGILTLCEVQVFALASSSLVIGPRTYPSPPSPSVAIYEPPSPPEETARQPLIPWCPNSAEVCGIRAPSKVLSLPTGFPSLKSSSSGASFFDVLPVSGFLDALEDKLNAKKDALCSLVPFYTAEYISSQDPLPLWFSFFPEDAMNSMATACGKLSHLFDGGDQTLGYMMLAAAAPFGKDNSTIGACFVTRWCDRVFMFAFDGVEVEIPIIPPVLVATVALDYVAWSSIGLNPPAITIWQSLQANNPDGQTRFGVLVDIPIKPNLALAGTVGLAIVLPEKRPLVQIDVEAATTVYSNMDPVGDGIGHGLDHEVAFRVEVGTHVALLDPETEEERLSFDGPTADFQLYWQFLNDDSFTVSLTLDSTLSLGEIISSLKIKGFDIGPKLAEILPDLTLSASFAMYIHKQPGMADVYWGVRFILSESISINQNFADLLGIGASQNLKIGFSIGAEPGKQTALAFLYGNKYKAVEVLEVGQGTCVLNLQCKSNRCCQSGLGICADTPENGGCCANQISTSVALYRCGSDKPYCYNYGDAPTWTCYSKLPNGAVCSASFNAGCQSGCCNNNAIIGETPGKCRPIDKCVRPEGELCLVNDHCKDGCCNNNALIGESPAKCRKDACGNRPDLWKCNVNSDCAAGCCNNNAIIGEVPPLCRYEACGGRRTDGMLCNANSDCARGCCNNNIAIGETPPVCRYEACGGRRTEGMLCTSNSDCAGGCCNNNAAIGESPARCRYDACGGRRPEGWLCLTNSDCKDRCCNNNFFKGEKPPKCRAGKC